MNSEKENILVWLDFDAYSYMNFGIIIELAKLAKYDFIGVVTTKQDMSFFENQKSKCFMLVVDKNKSFDKSLKGDFNIENNLINRKNKDNLKYIYTGLQIIKPEVFFDFSEKVFSMNQVWNKLIKNEELELRVNTSRFLILN